MVNHFSNRRHILRYIPLLAMLMLVLVSSAKAQMFSMDEESPRPRFNYPRNEVFVAFEPTVVSYQGAGDVDKPGAYGYDAPILRLGYSSRGLNLYLGVGGSITGSSDIAYFDVGGNINAFLSLHRSKKFILQIPFRISSSLVNITNDQTGLSLERFRFGSLTAGAGLQAIARLSSDIRTQLTAVPSYGFTFASGGLFGGGLGTVALNGRLFMDHLFSDRMGLSVGYKFDFRSYNIEQEKFDYQMQGHSIQLGITF
ncbi:MAG TPA: hypothetical protein VK112_12280 [Fodinibius sp.]|nr:hypothetical protein [Fodinibius sp.]